MVSIVLNGEERGRFQMLKRAARSLPEAGHKNDKVEQSYANTTIFLCASTQSAYIPHVLRPRIDGSAGRLRGRSGAYPDPDPDHTESTSDGSSHQASASHRGRLVGAGEESAWNPGSSAECRVRGRTST